MLGHTKGHQAQGLDFKRGLQLVPNAGIEQACTA